MKGLTAPNPCAISADGLTIVGHFSPGVPFIYRKGKIARFATQLKTLDPYAQALSSDGSVIVGRAESAFKWSKGGKIASLKNLSGFEDSFAFGVSGDGGRVVGYRQTETGGDGFIWKTKGGVSLIEPPAGISNCFPMAISSNGKTVIGMCLSGSDQVPY